MGPSIASTFQRFNESRARAQNFAGAFANLVMNFPMLRRAILAGAGFLGVCFPVAAQQTLNAPAAVSLYPPHVFETVDSAALIHDLPVFALLDGNRLPVSTDLGQMGRAPLDLPALSVSVAAQGRSSTRSSAPGNGKDALEEVINTPLHPVYATGEVGVLYGRWSGKASGDLWQTYVLGEVGNDKFSISVGVEYDEWSVRFPRFHSFAPSR
jgi:hypothetical protein